MQWSSYKLKKISLTVGLGAILLLSTASQTLAQTCNQDTNTPRGVFGRVGCVSGWAGPDTGETSIEKMARIFGMIVSIILGFVGTVFIIMGLWAGYLWMTARGNSEKVSQSQEMLRNAIIGAIIVFSIFAITRTVLSNVSSAIAPAGF